MSITQNLEYEVVAGNYDFITGIVTVIVRFWDTDPAVTVGTQIILCRLAGGAVVDTKGRVLTGSPPSGLVTDAEAFKSRVLTLIANGVTADKVRP